MRPRTDTLILINATFSDGTIGTLRIQDDRISSLGKRPRAGERVVDLHGDRVLPGLINAHDHLQLNTFPALDYSRAPYRNAREWIVDVNARLRSDRAFAASAAVPREQRLFLGGLKNLLSGVTTVAHHDPLYATLGSAPFPTRVLTNYGWSHSLDIDGEESVRRSYRHTPDAWPWIVHAAEGLDNEATSELDRLHALRCLGPNTLIVHGVALGATQRALLAHAGAGLIWCPSSNLQLFDRTAEISDLLLQRRVALGTDSRLSGSRDLLDELRVAAKTARLGERALEALVTRDSAQLLRRMDRGILRPGALADLLVLPKQASLARTTRADVRLVMIGGIARYGDAEYVQACAPRRAWAEIHVDGRTKRLDGALAASLHESGLCEAGAELPEPAWRVA